MECLTIVFFRISEKVFASENRRKLVMDLRNVTISFFFFLQLVSYFN